MKLTMYVKASKMNSWEEGYDEAFPYNIEYELDDTSYEHRWIIGSFEIEFPEYPVGNNMVVEAQVQSLEETLKKANAAHHQRAMRLEDKIASLTALPAPEVIDA